MKFLGYTIIMALLSLVSVYASSQPTPIYIDDGIFEYYLNEGLAHIIKIINTDTPYLYINPYVYHNGRRYNVCSFSGVNFKKSRVETIHFPSHMEHSFSLGDALTTAPNLKTLEVEAMNVNASYDSFEKMALVFTVKGNGLDNLMLSYARSILTFKYKIKVKKYTYKTPDSERKKDLFELGRLIKRDFEYNLVTGSNNGAKALIFKKGDAIGIARVFRTFARAMGMDYHDVEAGGDNKLFGWNYVQLSDRRWVNFDVRHTDYDKPINNAFLGDNDFATKVLAPAYIGKTTITPSTWVIYTTDYGKLEEYQSKPTDTEDYSYWLLVYRYGVRTK